MHEEPFFYPPIHYCHLSTAESEQTVSKVQFLLCLVPTKPLPPLVQSLPRTAPQRRPGAYLFLEKPLLYTTVRPKNILLALEKFGISVNIKELDDTSGKCVFASELQGSVLVRRTTEEKDVTQN